MLFWIDEWVLQRRRESASGRKNHLQRKLLFYNVFRMELKMAFLEKEGKINKCLFAVCK
jgi:hypothetical protein